MKKRDVLLMAATAVLAFGAVMTSHAAGWTMEDGSWVYEDSSGYLVYNEWRRGADNMWRYLDGYGHMAVSSWVDEVYYVDENGIMVTGGWKELDSNPGGYTDESHWYYFQENGKAVSDSWKKISGKWYHFDSDCQMETGWVDEDMYFCGEDGAAVTGWSKLYPPEDTEEYWNSDPFYEGDGTYWYYFNSSGKKYVPTDGSEYMEKRIDGAYYCFDSNGAMQTGWVASEGSGDSIGDYRFYGNDGKVVTGWYTAYPPEALASNYENEVEWFYFSSSGAPKVGTSNGTLTTSDFVRINNKSYLFNANGNPVYGLQIVKAANSDEEYLYYFDEVTRTAVTGRKQIDEGDGTTATYYFASTGRGYTGVYSGSLYYMGKLQKAMEGAKYDMICVNERTYLVNSAGRVVKNTSGTKDAYGTKYTTNSSGVVTKIDGVDFTGAGREPDAPVISSPW